MYRDVNSTDAHFSPYTVRCLSIDNNDQNINISTTSIEAYYMYHTPSSWALVIAVNPDTTLSSSPMIVMSSIMLFFFYLQGVIVLNLSVRVILETVTGIIIHMKKLLDFDWLRTVQFKCKTVQKVYIV